MKGKCPKCNSDKVVPILYGYPSGDMVEKLSRGEIEIGGCIVMPDNPKWHCNNCENEWK